jgi:serine protease Do
VYEISAAVSPGMSGGPAVDAEGRVIGVNSFGIVGEPQPFNFIRPSSLVAELLTDKGVRNESGKANAAYRAACRPTNRGDRNGAIPNLREALAAVPSHALAQEYLGKARRVPAPKQPAAKASGAPMLGGAVAILLALAAGAVLVIRRWRTGAPLPAPAAVVTPAAAAATEAPGTKTCTECAETIKAAARVCHYCGHRFDEAQDEADDLVAA